MGKQTEPEYRLYTIAVRHIGGSEERECVVTFEIVSDDEKQAVRMAKREYVEWLSKRVEATVSSRAFMKVDKTEGGYVSVRYEAAMPGQKTYPPERE